MNATLFIYDPALGEVVEVGPIRRIRRDGAEREQVSLSASIAARMRTHGRNSDDPKRDKMLKEFRKLDKETGRPSSFETGTHQSVPETVLRTEGRDFKPTNKNAKRSTFDFGEGRPSHLS